MEIEVDVREFNKGWGAIYEKQIPFATMKGLNALAEAFQQDQRAHQRTIFTVRRPDWVDRSVKITHFAKKNELWAEVGIVSPGGGERSDILGKFERSTTKRPFSGSTVAIPVGARRNKNDIIPKGERPRALLAGGKRVFMLDMGGGQKAIFRRVGARFKKGRMIGPRLARHDPNLVLLYWLKPSVKIRPGLNFHRNALLTLDTKWKTLFEGAWRHAVATAR